MEKKLISKTTPSLLRQEGGNTLLIFIFILATLAALAVGTLQVTTLNLESSHAHRKGKKAFYAAEVGLDLAINDIISEFENLSVYTTSANFGGDAEGYITESGYRGHDVKYKITNPLENYLYQTVVGNGIIYHYAHSFDVEAQSTSLADNSKETLREQIRILETPLVQYYIFYGGSGNAADLEILPGPVMDSWGRIHANGDIYIGTNNAFNLRNYDDVNNLSPHFMTSGGQIFAERKNDGSTYNPTNVTIKTGDPGTTAFTPTQVIPVGGIINGNESAQELLFNDYVLINEQQYQAPNQTQFVRNGFYEQRSTDPKRPDVDGIKIVGQGGLGAGNIEVFVSRPAPNTDVTALVLAGQKSAGNAYSGPMPIIRETTSAFNDCREGDDLDLTDIDIYALELWYEEYLTENGLTPAGSGYLIYTSRSPDATFTNTGDPMQAIRLISIGGISQVRDETTVATDNPIYIDGNFNTGTTKGVAIVADAINILSESFAGKACGGGLANATVTTINAALFGGNVPTPAGGGIYSGGLENYPRFHESWSGVNCNIRGSFINLWSSSQAQGNWVYGGDRYQAPNRTWGWDVNFENPNYWPPFIPSIFSVERVGFLE